MRKYGYMGLLCIAVCATPAAIADDIVSYIGSIDVGLPLGRIVADPVRPKVYGITGDGDVVFIDRTTWTVEKVISTGRVLRDIDIAPSNEYLTVLDNVTGEYWNQPPAVYTLDFDLTTQTQTNIVLAQAPLYQMAHGREGRIVGVATNQWVDAYQLDADTGELLDSTSAGYYGGTSWQGPNLFLTNSSGTRLYRTEIGISSIDLLVFDTSTDEIIRTDSRTVGSYANEPLFLNSTDTSLYVGDIRVDPENIHTTLAVFPENILAATGDDSYAFGVDGIYDATWGNLLQDMPAGYEMMALGEHERYLYTFDQDTQQLHVMSVVPEPHTVLLLLLGMLLLVPRH